VGERAFQETGSNNLRLFLSAEKMAVHYGHQVGFVARA
jgi:hypothetical protein